MAKNPFWLRGARGKFAGGVVQKGENGSILRQNVKPSNPQTIKQMAQRVAWATISKAAVKMLPVIGQTFEGAGSEKLNRREFFKANLAELRAAYLRSHNGDVLVGDPYFPYAAPKDVDALIPNRYVVSKGSLIASAYTPAVKTSTNAEVSFLELVKPTVTLTYPYEPTTTKITVSGSDFLYAVFGLKPGQQLTLCGIATKNGENVQWEANVSNFNGDIVRYSQFFANRLVAKTADSISDIELGITVGESSVTVTSVNGVNVASVNDFSDRMREALIAMIDTEKSSSSFLQAIGASIIPDILYGSANGVVEIIIEGLQSGYSELSLMNLFAGQSEYSIVAAATFISQYENSKWRYSDSKLVLLPAYTTYLEDNDESYGAKFDVALSTYVIQGASGDSTLYTRRGGDVNNI